MKRICFVIAIAAFSIAATAQKDSANIPTKDVMQAPARIYCVELKDGEPIVLMNEKPLKNGVNLKNGSKLTTSGTIINKDGSAEQMKPGACIDLMGEEAEEAAK